jgi:hypothetical protein
VQGLKAIDHWSAERAARTARPEPARPAPPARKGP